MGKELLVNETIDAGAAFLRDFNEFVPVSVAFWVMPAESDNLFLYVASDDIGDHNFDAAYGEVLRKLNDNRSPWLDPFQIKLVPSSDPIAQEAIRIRDRFPISLVTRYGGSSLGGIGIEEACIYPPMTTLKLTP